MDVDEYKKRFVWVKDRQGVEYVCRLEDLKTPDQYITDLDECACETGEALGPHGPGGGDED